MANFYCTSRTNYFRVTNEERYQELFSHLLCMDDDVADLTKQEDGVTYHGFGGYGAIEYCECLEDADCEFCIDYFLNEIQKILPEGEAFVLMEGGFEKLRYVTGYVVVVTKNSISHMDLHTWVLECARKELGADFETQLAY